ncbi:MAG: PEGA domain-containing protein, partial [Nitrospiraceae bacterium]|nr:PEGA domain-containing protein [Nitrospiraceae bacterium]
MSSTPSGASIYLDSTYRGTTPKTLTDVPVGAHTIKLTKSGYEDYTETVYVSAGESASVIGYLTATPTPTTVATSTPTPTGDIRVGSSPSGARIYLDGVYQGVTGSDWFRIYDVSTGYRTIRLEKSGYEDYTETVYISAGDTASVSAHLTATLSPTTVVTSTPVPTGSIRVWSSPSGADIYLDGVYQGLTGSNWFWIYEVSAGYHTIRLEKSRYEDYTETVYVSAGTTSVSDAGSVYACHAASVYATLTQETDSISVSSAPSGADIYLDGAYKGMTPTTISDASPGSHTL